MVLPWVILNSIHIILFLKDSFIQKRIILAMVEDKISDKVEKSINKIKNLLSRYFLGLLMQISILLIIYTIVLTILDVQNAFVIAFLCALLNLIPYLGPIIGAFLISILTMSSFIGSDFSTIIMPKTLFVLVGFLIGQMIDNFFSQPFIFSNSVKSHPLKFLSSYLQLEHYRSCRNDLRNTTLHFFKSNRSRILPKK